MAATSGQRVCVIGLDGLEPSLVFDTLAADLPVLAHLRARAGWGRLRSTIPPITVPAWASMVTSQDPGQLGVYGFRGRADRNYGDGARLATSLSYSQPPLWTLLSRAGRRCHVLSVPQTHPPKPVRGRLVSDVVTGPGEDPFTYPPELSATLRAQGFADEVRDYRDSDVERVVANVTKVSRQRFALARQWLAADDWDFFMMVDMTPDRAHHVAWTSSSQAGGELGASAEVPPLLRRAYVELDERLGELLAVLRDDDVLLVVSDHGGQPMHGGFAINDWLRQRGDLVLRDEPSAVTPWSTSLVDWSRTRLWAEGGYVARLSFNVRGREPQGIVEPAQLPSLVAELSRQLEGVQGPAGQVLVSRCFEPATIYREVRGVAPDLLLAVDDLRRRALASVGHPTLFPRHNDHGADAANHTWDGVVLVRDGRGARQLDGATLYDIAPTVFDRLGLSPPAQFIGKVLG